MKTTVTSEKPNAALLNEVKIARATAPDSLDSSAGATTKSNELGMDFREMQRLRYLTPFVCAIPLHRFGINE